MCGLVAVFTPEPLDEKLVIEMRDRLVHRGPDDSGISLRKSDHGFVGFGFRRLAIQDLSQCGSQPMSALEDQVVIVFNGEIYNFIELRKELRELGHQFRSQGDTEVLLAAYLQWGPDCLLRLNGQFSFVLWDGRTQTAFIARDRLGEKPLYFAEISGGGLAFSSEIKGLMAHPKIRCEVNDAHLKKYAAGIADYGSEMTMFKGVSQFLAAHSMVVTADGIIKNYGRYWTPSVGTRIKNYRRDDLVHEFGQRLKASVGTRLRADVKVGACLSGGLDSSSLVALMADGQSGHRDQFLQSISARFSDDPSIDEGRFIDLVATHSDIRSVTASLSPLDLADSSEKLMWHQEAPMTSASAYLEYAVHREARRAGLTVMIDGQGADEMLAGYQYYFAIRQNDWMNKKQFFQLTWNTLLMSTRLRRAAKEYSEPQRRFSSKAGSSVSHLLMTSLGNSMRHRLGMPLHEQPTAIQKAGIPSPEGGNYLASFLASGLLYDVMPNQLVVSDRNAMASSVEARFPFLDYNLIDWCLQLPEDLLIRNGWQKWILRKSMSSFLPSAVAWRADKVGFQAPQDKWIRGPLKEWAHDLLFSGPIVETEDYDRELIQTLWDQHQAGSDLTWSLWRWITMNQWLQIQRKGGWRRNLAPTFSSSANLL